MFLPSDPQQQPAFFPILQTMGRQGLDQSPSVTSDPPPARVRVALEFLTDLAIKTMTRAAVNDMSIQEIPGLPLSPPEIEAKNAACNLLTSYFKGLSPLDQYESTRLAQLVRKDDSSRGPGTLIRCFACLPNPPRPGCQLCRGTGEILVYSTSSS